MIETYISFESARQDLQPRPSPIQWNSYRWSSRSRKRYRKAEEVRPLSGWKSRAHSQFSIERWIAKATCTSRTKTCTRHDRRSYAEVLRLAALRKAWFAKWIVTQSLERFFYGEHQRMRTFRRSVFSMFDSISEGISTEVQWSRCSWCTCSHIFLN